MRLHCTLAPKQGISFIVGKQAGTKQIVKQRLLRCRFTFKSDIVVSRDHDCRALAMHCDPLRYAFTSRLNDLAEPIFGILKLPFRNWKCRHLVFLEI